ncbi:MAG: hypothetical protein QOI10_1560 [Solirubrobacterales bacterium]|jgi:uncharacterized delta-60 repeat protein|nr:hypothetical protein [Solirubrobacterales bacterium]
MRKRLPGRLSTAFLIGFSATAWAVVGVAAAHPPRPVSATNEARQVLSQPNSKTVVAGIAYTCAPEVNACANFGAIRAWVTAVRFDEEGQIDRTFGGRAGRIAVELPPRQGLGGDLVDAGRLADGKLLLVADTGQDSVEALRFTRQGIPDPTYGDGGVATINVPSPAVATVSSNGDIFAVGSNRTPLGNPTPPLVVHLTPQGTEDQGFGTGGQALISSPTASLLATAITPDSAGGVLIGGTDESTNDHARTPVVMRLQPNGTLDPGFGTDGVAPIGPSTDQYGFADISVVEQLPSGQISAGGQVGKTNAASKGVPDCAAAFVGRLAADGTVDTAFGASGISQVHPEFCDVEDAVVDPGGETFTLSFGFAATLNRIDASGSSPSEFRVDKRAGVNAHHLRAYPAELALPSSGGLLVGLTLLGQGRHFTDVPSEPPVVAAFSLARFDRDGSRDLRYGERGLATWPHLKPKHRATAGN